MIRDAEIIKVPMVHRTLLFYGFFLEMSDLWKPLKYI